MGSNDNFLSCVSNASSFSAALACANAAIAGQPGADVSTPVSTVAEPSSAPGATLATWAASVPAAIGVNMNKLFDLSDAVLELQSAHGLLKPWLDEFKGELNKLGDAASESAKAHVGEAVTQADAALDRLKGAMEKAADLNVTSIPELELTVENGQGDVVSAENWIERAKERLQDALNPAATEADSDATDVEPAPGQIDTRTMETAAKNFGYALGMILLGGVAMGALGVKAPAAAPLTGPDKNPYKT